MIAALFDCDGTLYSGVFGRGLMRYASEHGRAGQVRVYYLSLLWPYLLRNLKILPEEKFQPQLMTGLAALLTGMTEAEGRALFEWLLHEYLLPTQRSDVIARLRQHQAQGHMVVLVSAQFLPCLELLGQHLQVAGVIGTRLEVEAGRYTGRILPPLITGPAKDTCTRELFAARALEIEWGASYAYADSITDQELLGMVGQAVAVYPDAKLHALAQAKRWEMIGTPKA